MYPHALASHHSFSPFFYSMDAISKESIWRSVAQLAAKWSHMEPTPAQKEEADFHATGDAAYAS